VRFLEVNKDMDIQRPSNARAKKIKRIVYVTVAVLLWRGSPWHCRN